jgi:hypothetical protein
LYRAPTKTFKIQFQKLKQKRLIITVKNPQTDLFGLLKSENTNLLWFKIIRFVFDIVLKCVFQFFACHAFLDGVKEIRVKQEKVKKI